MPASWRSRSRSAAAISARTWPNPAVGAVIVKDGVILARGWTQSGGRPHAEVEALRRAKKAAQNSLVGATMYVTLEPCSHQGKTPPCADAIVKAGIARVVSALEDPNPEVAGRGHEKLRAKGIAVEIGPGAEEARRVHAGHIARVTQDRPHVLLKMAISADGKVGLAGRKPVALSGEAARARVFQLRGARATPSWSASAPCWPTIRSSPAGCPACWSARRCAWCSTRNCARRLPPA